MKNFWKNKKVVITGAAGFIGSHAVQIFLAKGANITAVVSPKTDEKKLRNIFNSDLKKISIKKVDLLDTTTCLDVTQGCDIILNFAAMDGGSQFKQEHSAEIFKTNVRIVLNMLDAAVANKVDRFLLMSSIEVYPKNAKSPITEDIGWDSSEDANGYVWSKRFSEIVAKMYAKEYGLKIAIARPGNVYGPGDDLNKGRLIPTFISRSLHNETISIIDDPMSKKAFLYINDFIDAILIFIENGPFSDPINIVGGKQISLIGIADIIRAKAKSRSELVIVKLHNKKTPDRIVSNVKQKKDLRFKEKVSLEEGILLTIKDLKKYDKTC